MDPAGCEKLGLPGSTRSISAWCTRRTTASPTAVCIRNPARAPDAPTNTTTPGCGRNFPRPGWSRRHDTKRAPLEQKSETDYPTGALGHGLTPGYPGVPQLVRVHHHVFKSGPPTQVPRPGHAALVLGAQIVGYVMSKVFMDGGSGMNIIYADTLRRMKISLAASLVSSDTSVITRFWQVPDQAYSEEMAIWW